MLPDDQPAERRDARRSDPLVSLARLLEAARKRTGASALVLSDDAGLAIAGAGPSSTCDELAARAALSVRHPANDTVPCRLDVLARAMEVRRLRIDGIEVFLCADGLSPGAPGEAASGLASAVEGCERILMKGRSSSRRGL